jgi:hypothetical protein
MTFYRAKSDYFPLIPGSRWTYDVGGNTAIDSVVGDSTLAGRTCIVVLRDYAPEYWIKDITEVRQFVSLVADPGGRDSVLEDRYRRVYTLPLVEGATWTESYWDTIVRPGTSDSIFFNDSLSGRVAAIEDITTPAGTFIQCYRVDTYRDVKTVSASDTTSSVTIYSEWLAPGVGLVKRVTGTETLVLTAYEPGR